MNKGRFLGSAKFWAAVAGVLICSHAWAEGKPKSAARKYSSQVSCSLNVLSLICAEKNGQFKFTANMEQDISAGSNGYGTMSYDVSPTKYEYVNCDVDVHPDISVVTADIVCGGHAVTLSQPVKNTLFSIDVHGEGDFVP